MAESLIDWPLGLPQQPLLDGYQEDPSGMKIRTPMDAAVAKQRNRYSNTAAKFTAIFMFTNAQYTTFKNFFNTTLNHGALEFNQPIPGDGASTRVVRFTEENYSPSFLGTAVRVVCNLETLP